MKGAPPPHVRPGDWQCPNQACTNNRSYVFAKNASCPSCGTPKPEDVSGLVHSGIAQGATWGATGMFSNQGGGSGGGCWGGCGSFAGAAGTWGGGQESPPPWANPGDWPCPTDGCKNQRAWVFAKKAACPECGCLKPPRPQVVQARHYSQNAWGMMGGGMMSQMGGKGGCGTDAPPWTSPGDWQCPNEACRNNKAYVFGRKSECPECGSAKPGGSWGGAAQAQSMPAHASPGDWACPNVQCKNNTALVFSSKAACPTCGTAKPDAGQVITPCAGGGMGAGCGFGASFGGGKGQWGGSPGGGDWQCPNTECRNHAAKVFGSKSVCPSCGTAKPGSVRAAPY